jgi:hypothetical protein
MEGTGWFSVVFFVIFTIIGSLILLSLFIGIIAAEMEAALQSQKEVKEQAKFAADQCEVAGETGKCAAFWQLFSLMDEITPSHDLDKLELTFLLTICGYGHDTEDEQQSALFVRTFDRVDANSSEGLDFGEFAEFMLLLTRRVPWRKTGKDSQLSNAAILCLSKATPPEELEAKDRAFQRQLMVLGRDSPAGVKMANTSEAVREKVLHRRSTILLELGDGLAEKKPTWRQMDAVGQERLRDACQRSMPSGCISLYERMAGQCMWLAEHHKFSNFMLAIILLAGLLVGLQVGYGLEGEPGSWDTLTVLDLIVFYFFLIEVALKLLSFEYAPWLYFTCDKRYFLTALVLIREPLTLTCF